MIGYDILTISEVLYACRLDDNTSDWLLFDLYKVAKGYPMHISQFGHVDNMQFELYMRPTTGSRRKNLEGLVQPCVLCVSVIWIVSADGIILTEHHLATSI